MTEDRLPDSNPVIYVPVGADALFIDPRESVVACDVIDRAGSRHEGVAIHSGDAQARYGRPGAHTGKRRRLFDTVRDGLLDKGVIETTGSYFVGARAKTYRLTGPWQQRRRVRRPGAQFKTPEYGDGAAEVPKWLRYCAESATYDMEAAHLYLLGDVGVDAETARRLVDACRFADGGSSEGYNAITEEIERLGIAVDVLALFNDRITSLWRWRIDRGGRAEPCHRDPSGLRLHTPITNLARELRPFLGFGRLAPDAVLYEIDARNSQPAILASLAVRELGTPDAHNLAQFCKDGQFYEETFRIVNGRKPDPAEREAWKSHIMGKWLFAGIQTQTTSKEGKALAKVWPNVDAWIQKRKQSDPRGKAALPCDMQQQEAALWIDRLAPALESAGIPVFTIHDSAVVPEAHYKEAKRIIEGLYVEAEIQATLAAKPITIAEPGALQRAAARNAAEHAAEAAKIKRRAAAKRRQSVTPAATS